jgi:hypothetical protein
MDEGDLLDDTLYLLNTCKSKHAPVVIMMLIRPQPRNNGQEHCQLALDLLDDMVTP